MKLSNVVPTIPRQLSSLCFGGATAGQTVCSLLFMLGIQEVLMARLLLAFLIPVTFAVHDLWTIETEVPLHSLAESTASLAGSPASRKLPNFPTEFDNEFVHFFKNVGMIGGLVVFLEMQP
jgi:uncharacterized membrane protein YphA (DoxX/SURF4 family)